MMKLVSRCCNFGYIPMLLEIRMKFAALVSHGLTKFILILRFDLGASLYYLRSGHNLRRSVPWFGRVNSYSVLLFGCIPILLEIRMKSAVLVSHRLAKFILILRFALVASLYFLTSGRKCAALASHGLTEFVLILRFYLGASLYYLRSGWNLRRWYPMFDKVYSDPALRFGCIPRLLEIRA